MRFVRNPNGTQPDPSLCRFLRVPFRERGLRFPLVGGLQRCMPTQQGRFVGESRRLFEGAPHLDSRAPRALQGARARWCLGAALALRALTSLEERMRDVLVGALMLVSGWFVSYGVVRASGTNWLTKDVGLVLVSVVLLLASIRLQVRFVRFLATGLASYLLVKLGVHAVWGADSLHGRPAQMAILASAFVGVGLGAVVLSRFADRVFRHLRPSRANDAVPSSGVR